MGATERILLVDGSGYIFRAFYAIRELSTRKGFPTNALFGFTKMMLKLLEEEASSRVVMVFDAGRETFRMELFPEYKANRDECPPDLSVQMPYFRKISQALGLPVLEKVGVEADDIIGTLAEQLSKQEAAEVVIVSGDKDLMQLVTDSVHVYDSMRMKHFAPRDVEEKFGVPPERIVDYLALVGDSSDNVPGVAGVGPKTAAQLVARYGDVESILSSIDAIAADTDIRARKKVSESLRNSVAQLRLSKQLVTVLRDVDLNGAGSSMSAEALFALLERSEPRREELMELIEELEFHSLFEGTPGIVSPTKSSGTEEFDFVTVTKENFGNLLTQLQAQKSFAFDVETTSLSPLEAELCGMAICFEEDRAYYIPVSGHHGGSDTFISLAELRNQTGEIFSNPDIKKIAQNAKYDIEVLSRAGFTVAGLGFDTLLAAYLLEPDNRSHSLSALSLRHLNIRMSEFSDVVPRGETFSAVPIEEATQYAAEDALCVFLLWPLLEKEIEKTGLSRVLRELELPLVEVLAALELRGMCLDKEFLETYSLELLGELEDLQARIFEEAGEEFNINSPKQLSVILFEKLGVPTRGLKKTKTGISTDSSVLEQLAHDYELPNLLLRYRLIHKLKSTYVDALPEAVSPVTGRLHTKLNQAVTATGRLSSSEPNLQNIPIQTAEGRKVRAAFVASPGKALISADYSQIELRVLAHLSNDENLIAAFRDNVDIHARTAREILGLGEHDELAPDLRRMGKTINFGIVYGMSAFRLSRDLGIPVGLAKEYIDGYFARFPGVKKFFKSLEQQALEQGYVETLFGRKRFLSTIDVEGRDKGFLLRAALNAPIQGSAADLIKLAMIHVHRARENGTLAAELLLQIHDELLFEVDEQYAERSAAQIEQLMANVADLNIPLATSVHVGRTWEEAH